MTREEAKKAAEVMLAYANGEKIERLREDGYWVEDNFNPLFNWFENEYRVKPKEKFNPKSLQPFDRVLVFGYSDEWTCDFYSHAENDIYGNDMYLCVGDGGYVIPYNDDTKHLVGTSDEAPEFYRYWEE